MRILIADDSALIRERLIAELAESGFFTVDQAQTGDEAIELFVAHKPDIVILDINMPGKNGLEALTAIRSKSMSAVVAIYSSFDQPRFVARCQQLGANAFFSKARDFQLLMVYIRDQQRIYKARTSSLADQSSNLAN